jgi:hypothetical protein
MEEPPTDPKLLPVLKAQCATCPWREGSPHAYLKESLEDTLMECSRICHSTGSNNAINKRTGKPPMLCRGARDIQNQTWFDMGFIEAPTDEAWDKKLVELGLK